VASSKRTGRSGESKGPTPPSRKPSPSAKPSAAPAAVVVSPWKGLAVRIGLPILVLWVIGGIMAGFWTSTTGRVVTLGLPALLTIAGLALLVWALRQTRRARAVAGVLSNVDTAEDRKAALQKLEQGFSKNDPAAIFAKAQGRPTIWTA
jgi:hypothetical protein